MRRTGFALLWAAVLGCLPLASAPRALADGGTPVAPPSSVATRMDSEPALRTRHFEVYLRGLSLSAVAPLFARADAIAARVASPLGVPFPRAIRVVVAGSRDAFLAALPAGLTLPDTTLGVAFHHERLIVLRNAPGIAATFEHEASHIALLHATAPARPPRWFIEGFAAYQAQESPLERMDALRQASAVGALIPLRALESHFPAGSHGTQLAYAQSNEMITYLLATYGESKFRTFVARLAAREPFEAAIERTFGLKLDALEAAYVADLRTRFDWVPFVTGSAALYLLMAIVFLIAYVRQRRRTRARLAEMAREEEATEARPPSYVLTYSADGERWTLTPLGLEDEERPQGPATAGPTMH